MAKVTIRDEEAIAGIDAIIEGFRFTLTGTDQSLGRDLAGVVAGGIQERSIPDSIDPDGGIWFANSEGWADYKLKRYGVEQPGELGGQMLSLESLKGQMIVTDDRVEMVYGTGDLPPPDSRSGVPLRESERKATDREKAEYFTDSGRRFYELDDTIAEKVTNTAAEAFEDHAAKHGAI